ncbi:hypothetical protein [Thiomicrorhabdus aquaedulcis]|uniref:hypothetical protein n=1 Tax=Thiomicrorhabdus aquaedulcis TaxID=2211106 RepID=UPI001561BD7E|nr:hypothetical protein [Thiomicrorhabdus aquaedulcis]
MFADNKLSSQTSVRVVAWGYALLLALIGLSSAFFFTLERNIQQTTTQLQLNT